MLCVGDARTGSGPWYVCCAALRNTADEARVCDKHSAICAHIADPDPTVREAAQRALAGVATHGDEEAIAQFLRGVDDETDTVCEASLQGLAAVAPRGHKVALARVLALSSRPSLQVAALDAIGRLGLPGDEASLSAVRSALSGNVETRFAAVRALVELSPDGDAKAVELLVLASRETIDMECPSFEVGSNWLGEGLAGPGIRDSGSTFPAFLRGFDGGAPNISAELNLQAPSVQDILDSRMSAELDATGPSGRHFFSIEQTFRAPVVDVFAEQSEPGLEISLDEILGYTLQTNVRDSTSSWSRSCFDCSQPDEIVDCGPDDTTRAPCFGDADWRVRVAAVQGLARLAPKGPGWAYQAVIRAARDTQVDVRVAAIGALTELAEDDEEDVILAVLIENSRHPNRAVRKAVLPALSALGKAELRADNRVVEACLDIWEVSLADVELETLALTTLRELVNRNDTVVIRRLVRVLESQRDNERFAAVEAVVALTDCSKEVNECLLSGIARRVACSSPAIRRTAADAFCRVFQKGDPVAVAALLRHVWHADKNVRLAVILVVQRFAARGDTAAGAEMVKLLSDSDDDVRIAAIKTLVDLSRPNEEDNVRHVCALLGESEIVRDAARAALPRLADMDHIVMLECLERSCKNLMPLPKRENARCAACQVLCQVASRGSTKAVDILRFTIDPVYPLASRCALEALAHISYSGNTLAIDTAVSALSHPDPMTRNLACEVLEVLTELPKPSALATAVTMFDGHWTSKKIGGRHVIRGCRIFLADGGVAFFEIKRETLLTMVDGEAKRAQLNGTDQLLWLSSGDIWFRSAGTSIFEPKHRSVQDDGDAGVERETLLSAPNVSDSDNVGLYSFAAVKALFSHVEEAVLVAAVRTVPAVVWKGCDAAVECLVPMVNHESVLVRLAAIDSLSLVASKGDLAAVQALKERLQDQEMILDTQNLQFRSECVGKMSAKALRKVATPAELKTIASGLSFDGSARVRGSGLTS